MRVDQRMPTERPLWLIGDAGLCARYRLAAAEFSVELAPAVGDTAAAGLWWLARAGGLLDPSGPDTPQIFVAGVSP
jgi:2-dehydro-3-deoxygalactonokinase